MEKIKKLITLSDRTDRFIARLMDKYGTTSYTEVVRRAVTELYDSEFPAYLEKSVPARIKEKNLIEKENFSNMSETVYALNVLHGIILSNEDGVPFVIMHWFGNALGAKPLDGCKEWFSTRPDIIDNHLMLSKKTPIEKAILDPGNRDSLKRNYGITVPDQQTNPADTQLPVS